MHLTYKCEMTGLSDINSPAQSDSSSLVKENDFSPVIRAQTNKTRVLVLGKPFQPSLQARFEANQEHLL
jgi:hypothetical protein